MIRKTTLTGVLVLLVAFLLGACASATNDTLSGPSASESGAAVPGEKMSDDERYSPGPMGGNVHW